MIKINELTETRYRTIYYIDEYGNRERDREEYIGKREVKSLSTPLRMANFVIDMILYQIITTVIVYIFSMAQALVRDNVSYDLTVQLGFGLSMLAIYPLYYLIFEFLLQRTPGKYITKTIVVNEYGEKPDLGAILLRTMLRLVPFEVFSCYGDKYSYGWHDKYSKTWTIPTSELEELRRLQIEQMEEKEK